MQTVFYHISLLKIVCSIDLNAIAPWKLEMNDEYHYGQKKQNKLELE